ncbi:unnamed protein product [Parajaminaea phylloscopi]
MSQGGLDKSQSGGVPDAGEKTVTPPHEEALSARSGEGASQESTHTEGEDVSETLAEMNLDTQPGPEATDSKLPRSSSPLALSERAGALADSPPLLPEQRACPPQADDRADFAALNSSLAGKEVHPPQETSAEPTAVGEVIPAPSAESTASDHSGDGLGVSIDPAQSDMIPSDDSEPAVASKAGLERSETLAAKEQMQPSLIENVSSLEVASSASSTTGAPLIHEISDNTHTADTATEHIVVETQTHESDHVLETSPVTSPGLPDRERSLPPPPLPSKTNIELEGTTTSPSNQTASQEKKAVARAFGVDDEAELSTNAQTRISSKPVPDTPAISEKLNSASPLPRTPTSAGLRIGKGPPPSTAPSEEKPFDFNRFLEQMKDPSAKGVGEYVRSFIRGFAKKPYRTVDQIKLIFDFLDFIADRMRQCSVWNSLPDAEFDNAREAMEKLVMNRLYNLTFTPAVAKEGRWTPQTDDLERDKVLAQRIELFSWIKEEHLDVPTGDHSRGFIDFAIQELLKINHYKAPRDKLICILNCCKVIFGLIRHLGSDENADTFVPVLIFVVLKANPEHLISNVEYIGRFRDPSKLSSESGYYLSSLMGATAFIETMDYSSLSNISHEDFEKNVEAAVARVGTRQSSPHVATAPDTLMPGPHSTPSKPGHHRAVSASDPHAPPAAGEEAARTLPGPGPVGAANFAEDTKAFLQRTSEAARIGFSNSLGKPIGALGKLLGDGLDGMRTPNSGVGPSGSYPSSGVGSPARGNSPAPSALPGGSAQQPQQPPRRGVFGGLFGQDSADTNASRESPLASGSFNPVSWTRSFRPGGAYDEEEPQTPISTENRQGPFSSLVRNPDYSNVPPARRIGEVPFAPPHRPRQPTVPGQKPGGPQRSDSLDPFNSPDPNADQSGHSATSSRRVVSLLRRGSEHSDGIGTPSNNGSDDEDEEDGLPKKENNPPNRRLPDLGAFVPSFLTETPGPASRYGHEEHLRRGPHEGRTALPGHSSVAPSSDGFAFTDPTAFTSEGGNELAEEDISVLSADVERVHAEQLQAAVETLRSVFPDTDDEVRRMVLEACDGDVATAIDRLLEMQSGD